MVTDQYVMCVIQVTVKVYVYVCVCGGGGGYGCYPETRHDDAN